MKMLQLNQVAESSHTARNVFEDLSKRERFRRETNLINYERKLLNSGKKIIHGEYLQVWKMLQDLGVGSLIIGRNKTPTRFIWNYNLKDVAKSVKYKQPLKEETTIPPQASVPVSSKRGRGRPKGSKNKKTLVEFSPKHTTTTGSPEILIRIPAGALKPDQLRHVLDLMRRIEGAV